MMRALTEMSKSIVQFVRDNTAKRCETCAFWARKSDRKGRCKLDNIDTLAVDVCGKYRASN